MYKKIVKLSNFGSFSPIKISCPDFSSLNLIYGANYTGKTTLSRIFSSIKTGLLHTSLNNAEFMLQTYDGQIITNKALITNSNIRVFNEEYIQANIHWGHTLESFLVIGEENREQIEYLKLFQDRLSLLEIKIDDLKNKQTKKEKNLESKLSSTAKQVRELFSIPGYNRSHFLKSVDSYANEPRLPLLTSTEQRQLYLTAISTEKKETISLIESLRISIPDLVSELIEIMTNDSPSATLDELRSDSDLSDWVEKGLSLHNNSDICRFCGQPLPQYLMDQYRDHFSEHYRDLQNRLSEYVTRIHQLKCHLITPSPAEFYQEQKDEFNQSVQKTVLFVERINQRLDELIGTAQRKQQHLFDDIEVRRDIDDGSAVYMLNSEIETINELISRNNRISSKFEYEKEQAKERLIRHIATSFIINEDYVQKKEELKLIETDLIKAISDIKQTKSSIQDLEAKISGSDCAAQMINSFLEKYYAKKDVHLEVAESGQFHVIRDGIKADFLSQSERTMIALSYFFGSLGSSRVIPEDTVIYIDDPVLGLDNNHLDETVDMIIDVLGISTFNVSSKLPYHQCFITTHNDYFYSRLKESCMSMCADVTCLIRMSHFDQEKALTIDKYN